MPSTDGRGAAERVIVEVETEPDRTNSLHVVITGA